VALVLGGDVVYVGGYTFSHDFPITGTASQLKLNGVSNGFFSAIDLRSGQLRYSAYLGGTAMAFRFWPGSRPALMIVKPETVIAWHRKGFRLYWTWKS